MRTVHGAIACSGMRMPGQRRTEMISLIVGTMAVVIIVGLIAAIEMILVIVCLFTGKDMTFIISPRSWQVPRPPGADDLYKGIYESFIEKGKDGRD
jgi:hypothetical protein